MFGVRTVVLGAELLFLKDPDELDRALRVGTLIHTSDALSAARAAARDARPGAGDGSHGDLDGQRRPRFSGQPAELMTSGYALTMPP